MFKSKKVKQLVVGALSVLTLGMVLPSSLSLAEGDTITSSSGNALKTDTLGKEEKETDNTQTKESSTKKEAENPKAITKKEVKIMHTNDMHGRLEYLEDKYSPSIGMGRVKTFKDNQKPTLLVDAGDAMQGLPISNYTEGMDMVKAMNAVGYDAMTLGNHEFDFGLDRALTYKNALTFPIVSANVYYKTGERPFDPYTIVEKDVNGEKQSFALIGLTTPETTVKTHPNNIEKVTFKKPAPVAIDVMKEIGDKADFFIFMTHLGVDETTVEDETSQYLAKQLAANFPDKKIFIADGHSHTPLPEGAREGHVLIGQTGNYLNNVGMMTGTYSGEEVTTQAVLHPFSELKSLTPDPKVEAIVQAAKQNFGAEMSQVALENNQIMFNGERENVRSQETNLGNIIGDAIYHYGQSGFKTPSDFAVVNGGGIRQSIKPGKVTKGDLVGVMPFGNTISQIKVTGNEIYQMFEHSLRSIPVVDEQGQVILDRNGLPKLGANGGFLHVSESLKVTYDSNLPGTNTETGEIGKRVLSIKLKDKTGKFTEVPRNDTTIYNMATNDFLAAGGDGYTMFQGKAVEEGPSMDAAFLGYLTNLKAKELAEYTEEFPAKRIVSQKSDGAMTGEFNFTIMHTNDMHGRMQYVEGKSVGLAKLKTYKDTIKPTLMLDAGDALQGLAISNFTKGEGMAKAMSLVPYDGVGVGNHEFDFGYEQAMAYKKQLPMISANVIKDGKSAFDAYKIIEKDGKKFGVIGLTTPETAFKTHPNNVKGLTFEDPIPVAKKLIDDLKEKVDAFTIISHLGVDPTTPENWRGDTLAQELSTTYPSEKIIILDGHSHTALAGGKQFGNVLLAQTGNYLNNVGLITVSYKDNQPTFEAKLVPATEFKDITENTEIKAIVLENEKQFDHVMSEVVIKDNPVYLEGDGAYGRTRETNLGDLIADALYNYGQTGFKGGPSDLAVINGGGIRTSVNKGKVTKGDLLAVLPFGNSIAQIDVTGKQLIEMFEQSLRSDIQVDEKTGQPILDERGFPLLGRNGGFLQVSDSVQVSYDPLAVGAKPEKNRAGQRVLSLKIKDRKTDKFELVKADQTYKLATNDFLSAGGDGYTMLGGSREEGPSMDIILTDFLQAISSDKSAKVTALAAKKYQLSDYAESFPYKRVIPNKQETAITSLTNRMTELKKLAADDYTAHSWQAFQEQIVDVPTILESKDEEAAAVKLDELKNSETDVLVSIKELKSDVTTAKKQQAKAYTKVTWKPFKQALVDAEKVLVDSQDVTIVVTNKKVLETRDALNQATKSLVKVSSQESGNEIDPQPETGKPVVSEESGKGKGSSVTRKPNQDSKTNRVLPKTGEQENQLVIVGLFLVGTASVVIYLKRTA